MSLEGLFVFRGDDVVRVDDGARKTMIAEAKRVRHLHQLARGGAVALRERTRAEREWERDNRILLNGSPPIKSNGWERWVGKLSGSMITVFFQIAALIPVHCELKLYENDAYIS